MTDLIDNMTDKAMQTSTLVGGFGEHQAVVKAAAIYLLDRMWEEAKAPSPDGGSMWPEEVSAFIAGFADEAGLDSTKAKP